MSKTCEEVLDDTETLETGVNETCEEVLLSETGVLVVVTLDALTVAGLVGGAVELGAAVLSDESPPVMLYRAAHEARSIP